MYQKNKMEILGIDSYQPVGWLKNQLELQKEGITLQLDEVWSSVSRFSEWAGGTDPGWERPPYWLDGLVPLVYLTQSEEGMQKAEFWMEWAIHSQRDNGDFGPTYQTAEFDEVMFWPKMVMMKAIISYYEIKRESRILEFMERYFTFCSNILETYQMSGWAQARSGDLAYSVCWLYEKTGNINLLKLLEKVNAQTLPWADYLAHFPFPLPTSFYYPWEKMEANISKTHLYDIMRYHATHVVNIAMGLKQPIYKFKETGEKRYLEALYKGMADLAANHGQVTGVYSGDEHLSGPAPTQGTELCSVVEMMFSLQQIFAQTGNSKIMDWLERITYNALPATISEDFKAHQYDQQVNQVLVSDAERNWYNNGNRANLFGFEPNFGCCLANMHQGWPKFVKNAFFVTQNEITVGAYMPVYAKVRILKTDVGIREETEYPFKGEIHFSLDLKQETEFSFRLRIPEWCRDFELLINDEIITDQAEEGYVVLKRKFQNRDSIILRLKMEVTIRKHWYHNGVTVERGPLLYVLNIAEKWKKLNHGHPRYPDYEIYPQSDWNYALDLREKPVVVKEHDLSCQAFSKKEAPIHIKAWGRKLENWKRERNSAGDLPQSPVRTMHKKEELDLIPYGCSKLRIGLFPWCEEFSYSIHRETIQGKRSKI